MLSINMLTLSCVKWIAGEKLLYNTGSPAWHSDGLEVWGRGRGGKLNREGIHMYNYVSITLLYSRKQHNTVK